MVLAHLKADELSRCEQQRAIFASLWKRNRTMCRRCPAINVHLEAALDTSHNVSYLEVIVQRTKGAVKRPPRACKTQGRSSSTAMTRSLQFTEGKPTYSAVKHDLFRVAYAFRAAYSAVKVSSKSAPHVDWSEQDSRSTQPNKSPKAQIPNPRLGRLNPSCLGCPETKMWEAIQNFKAFLTAQC